MIFTITLFVISLIVIFVMVISKMIEMKTGDWVFPIHWRHRGDHLIRKNIFKFKEFLKIKRIEFVNYLETLPSKFSKILSITRGYLSLKFVKFIDLVKGRKVLVKENSNSPFLNAVSEFKKELKDEEKS